MPCLWQLLDLDSDSGSQGWQAPLSYCDSCDGCIGPDEASVEVGGRRWHPSCLTCWVCGLPPDQRCFVTRLGHVLCIDDFNRSVSQPPAPPTCRKWPPSSAGKRLTTSVMFVR